MAVANRWKYLLLRGGEEDQVISLVSERFKNGRTRCYQSRRFLTRKRRNESMTEVILDLCDIECGKERKMLKKKID